MPIQSVIRLIRFFRIRAPLSASAASAGEFAGAGAGGNNSGATIPYSREQRARIHNNSALELL